MRTKESSIEAKIPYIPQGPITRSRAKALKDKMALFMDAFIDFNTIHGDDTQAVQDHSMMILEVQVFDPP